MLVRNTLQRCAPAGRVRTLVHEPPYAVRAGLVGSVTAAATPLFPVVGAYGIRDFPSEGAKSLRGVIEDSGELIWGRVDYQFSNYF